MFRLKILKWLDARYDRWLAQPEFIKIFLMFLKDSSVEVKAFVSFQEDSLKKVQSRALLLLGRLSKVNPGFIFPQFRAILVNYLRTLKCPGIIFMNTIPLSVVVSFCAVTAATRVQFPEGEILFCFFSLSLDTFLIWSSGCWKRAVHASIKATTLPIDKEARLLFV